MCICPYVCVYALTCVHTYFISTYTNALYIHVCIYIYTRTRARRYIYVHTHIYRERLVSFRRVRDLCHSGRIQGRILPTHTHTHKDLCHSGRIQGRILPTQIQPYDIQMQDLFCWNWSTLVQVIKNKKSCIWILFCPSIKYTQNGWSKISILLRFTSLDLKLIQTIFLINKCAAS